MTENKPIPEEQSEDSTPVMPEIQPEDPPNPANEQAASSSPEEPEEIQAAESEPSEEEAEAAEVPPGGPEQEPGVEVPKEPPPPPPPPPVPPPPPPPLSPSDERTWAMLAHLSVLLNLITGFLGPVAALVIYLAFKDRSRYVAYQSMQAFVFQMIWWVGAGLLAIFAWTISGLLAVILVGCLLMPLALLLTLIPVAALVYGVIGAVQCNQGEDFKYWLIGDWVRGTLTGT